MTVSYFQTALQKHHDGCTYHDTFDNIISMVHKIRMPIIQLLLYVIVTMCMKIYVV